MTTTEQRHEHITKAIQSIEFALKDIEQAGIMKLTSHFSSILGAALEGTDTFLGLRDLQRMLEDLED